MQKLTNICRKSESSLSFTYETLLRKEETWVQSKHCAAMNVFFHQHKLINFTMSLSKFCLKSVRIVLLTGCNTCV